MNNIDKWNTYVLGLQAHGSVCQGTQTLDSIRFITELIPVGTYNKILDIGAGEGLETSLLKQLGYNPMGIISGEHNKRWAKKHYPDTEFIDCDMHDLPFPIDTFDAIFTNQVFEHAYAPFIFLLECYSVLKPGGLFYVCTPKFEERQSPNNPSTIEAQWISHHHPSVFPPNVYRQLFEKTGFIVLKQDNNMVSFLLQKGPLNSLHPDVQQILLRRSK
jgi:SAM-dependent methyltransferase